MFDTEHTKEININIHDDKSSENFEVNIVDSEDRDNDTLPKTNSSKYYHIFSTIILSFLFLILIFIVEDEKKIAKETEFKAYKAKNERIRSTPHIDMKKNLKRISKRESKKEKTKESKRMSQIRIPTFYSKTYTPRKAEEKKKIQSSYAAKPHVSQLHSHRNQDDKRLIIFILFNLPENY